MSAIVCCPNYLFCSISKLLTSDSDLSFLDYLILAKNWVHVDLGVLHQLRSKSYTYEFNVKFVITYIDSSDKLQFTRPIFMRWLPLAIKLTNFVETLLDILQSIMRNYSRWCGTFLDSSSGICCSDFSPKMFCLYTIDLKSFK